MIVIAYLEVTGNTVAGPYLQIVYERERLGILKEILTADSPCSRS